MGSHGLRHGRGMRGELFCGEVPASMTRRQDFERLVAQAFADIRERAHGTLDHVHLAVDLLPPPTTVGRPPVAALFPADAQRPDTIVAYRAPVLRVPAEEATAIVELELATEAARLCAYSVEDLLGD